MRRFHPWLQVVIFFLLAPLWIGCARQLPPSSAYVRIAETVLETQTANATGWRIIRVIDDAEQWQKQPHQIAPEDNDESTNEEQFFSKYFTLPYGRSEHRIRIIAGHNARVYE